MHLSSPRIAPLADSDMSPEQQAAVEPLRQGPVGLLNIFRTLAHAPEALKAFLGWGNYILSKRNALAPREREIVILRTGYLCRSGYEWTQHVGIGKRVGLSDEEIARIKSGEGFGAADAALIRACDDLHARQFVSDATWAALKAHFSDKQCMDVVFTAGQYTQVSMMLNTFGVQLDAGQTLDPDLKG
ncbi:carboxymuconolactone decarboxylase family protein [Terricaulis sp.]|uniref:carboxymuconolactone decarboxylase family protein n=1 Tax=Terricaulis sp. TaxID=2768686 RepID=UPI003783D002